jgi:hypothetical protein
MVNNIEKQIIDIFRSKNIENDDIIGFMCVLRARKACIDMLKWLNTNEQSTFEDIKEKILDIYND